MEKGVDFIRRKEFSSVHSFNNFEEAEEHLLTMLKRINERVHHELKVKHVELMKKERSVSKPAIALFDADMIEVRVNKYNTIVIRQNHYSVPEGYV